MKIAWCGSQARSTAGGRTAAACVAELADRGHDVVVVSTGARPEGIGGLAWEQFGTNSAWHAIRTSDVVVAVVDAGPLTTGPLLEVIASRPTFVVLDQPDVRSAFAALTAAQGDTNRFASMVATISGTAAAKAACDHLEQPWHSLEPWPNIVPMLWQYLISNAAAVIVHDDAVYDELCHGHPGISAELDRPATDHDVIGWVDDLLTLVRLVETQGPIIELHDEMSQTLASMGLVDDSSIKQHLRMTAAEIFGLSPATAEG